MKQQHRSLQYRHCLQPMTFRLHEPRRVGEPLRCPSVMPIESAKMSIAKSYSEMKALLPFSFTQSVSDIPISIIAASFCANVTCLVLPLIVMQVYDRVIPNQAVETMGALAFVALVVIAFEAVVRLIRSHLIAVAASRQAWLAYSDAMARILSAPQHWWIVESPSRIVDRFRSLIAVTEWQASSSRLVLLDLPFVLIFFVLLAVIGGYLVLVPLAVLGTLGILVGRASRDLQHMRAALSAAEMRLHDFIAECLSNIQAIKGSALEQQMNRRHERLQAAVGASTADCSRISEQMRCSADLVSQVTTALILGIGAVGVMTNSLTIGGLACCSMLCGRAVQPILRCLGMWAELQALAIDRENGLALARLPAPRLKSVSSEARSQVPLRLELRGVTTAYSMTVGPALSKANLTIAAGSSVAVLGTAGPGTNVLAALLTERIDPVAGRLTLCPRVSAPTSVPNDASRLRLLETSQDTEPLVLMASSLDKPFDATLIENLTGFGLDCSVKDACDAAQLIGLDKDVDLLPNGYATLLATGTDSTIPARILVRLSIARAIARKPGLLVLDHVNESLDTATEQRLAEGLRALAGTMTILILTNRPSFAANADTIITIENGAFTPVSGAPNRAS